VFYAIDGECSKDSNCVWFDEKLIDWDLSKKIKIGVAKEFSLAELSKD